MRLTGSFLREQGLLHDEQDLLPIFSSSTTPSRIPRPEGGLVHRAVRTDDPTLKVGDAYAPGYAIRRRGQRAVTTVPSPIEDGPG